MKHVVLSAFILNGLALSCILAENSDYGECKAVSRNGRQLSFSIKRKRDQKDGRWGSVFEVRKVDGEGEARDITLEASYLKTECKGVNIVHVEAFIKDVEYSSSNYSLPKKDDNLLFHPRHGRNAVILDNGRSAQKLELEDPHHAVLFTNRPLKTNELFEVRLEQRTKNSNHCFGIGVMTYSPENVKIANAMYTLSNGTWMYHNIGIYQNGKALIAKYGHNIDTLEVRERVGVMRRDDGTLHFFVNGVDQGIAASKIPENVYGVFELWYDAVRGKIVY